MQCWLVVLIVDYSVKPLVCVCGCVWVWVWVCVWSTAHQALKWGELERRVGIAPKRGFDRHRGLRPTPLTHSQAKADHTSDPDSPGVRSECWQILTLLKQDINSVDNSVVHNRCYRYFTKKGPCVTLFWKMVDLNSLAMSRGLGSLSSLSV